MVYTHPIENLSQEQIKKLWDHALVTMAKTPLDQKRESLAHTSADHLAFANYFTLLIYEANKSGFEYAINHY